MANATNFTTTTQGTGDSASTDTTSDVNPSTTAAADVETLPEKKAKTNTPKFNFHIHQMEERFVPEVWAIQNDAYDSDRYRETQEILIQKLHRYPAGFLIATEESSGEIVAYTVCHPARLDDLPLDCDNSYELPDDSFGSLKPSDVFFINELTISPRWQGFSLGRIMYSYIVALALEQTNHRKLALISVSGSHVFWNKVGGFTPIVVEDVLHSRLFCNYGPYIAMTADIACNYSVPSPVLSKLPERLNASMPDDNECAVPVLEDYLLSEDEDSNIPSYAACENDEMNCPPMRISVQDVPV